LEHYCYLVASVVGLVCIRIFGYTDARAEPLAVNTGIAFQLTNILRDVKEDLERGRIYVPLEVFAKHGVAPERFLELTQGIAPQAAEILLLRALVQRAEDLYKSGEELIPLLDADSRSAMRVLMEIYHRLLLLIAKDVEAVFQRRLSVPTATKLAILGKGVIASAFARGK
jgi:phytoene synthase